MNSLVAVALMVLLCSPALVADAKEVSCRGVRGVSGNELNQCKLRPLPATCTSKDVTGGNSTRFTVDANVPPLCVTFVAANENDGSVTLYRGTTPYTDSAAPQTCVKVCERLRANPPYGTKLLYFGCVKKTDGDFINFGMADTNENSEVLTYLPLNAKKFDCPVEVQQQELAPHQSAILGVVGAGIVTIVVGALILYFGCVRSMPTSTAVVPSAPPAPSDSTF